MSVGKTIRPYLEELVKAIGQKNNFYGNRISPSIMAKFVVEERLDGAGILVPYWISVLQKGRGPRRSNKSSGLSKIIYKWMQKNSMFRSTTNKGKLAEARFMTMYINKYGNKQFQNKVFIDIYETERKKTIAKIDKEISTVLNKVTMDVI